MKRRRYASAMSKWNLLRLELQKNANLTATEQPKRRPTFRSLRGTLSSGRNLYRTSGRFYFEWRTSMAKSRIYFVLGMLFSFTVQVSAGQQVSPKPTGGKVRTYYVAADEVEWDYAPEGIDHMTGKPFEGYAKVHTERGPHRIGTKYRDQVPQGLLSGIYGRNFSKNQGTQAGRELPRHRGTGAARRGRRHDQRPL